MSEGLQLVGKISIGRLAMYYTEHGSFPVGDKAFELARETAKDRAGQAIARFVDCGDFGILVLPEGRYERLMAKPVLWPRYCTWLRNSAPRLWEAGYI